MRPSTTEDLGTTVSDVSMRLELWLTCTQVASFDSDTTEYKEECEERESGSHGSLSVAVLIRCMSQSLAKLSDFSSSKDKLSAKTGELSMLFLQLLPDLRSTFHTLE